MFRLYFLVLISALIFCPSNRGDAQTFVPPMPKDIENTRISLMTVDLGQDLYARYGHTMIRIQDPSNRLDYMVNWGIFDFSDPWFIPKFFRGILIYQMGFSGSQATINYYRDVERRGVVEDELALTSSQKKKLMDKIIWNAQPENYRYPYQYFRNNCATIPRDYLDEVTGHALKPRFESVKSKMTYRDYVRENLAINPFVAWGLDVLFNSDNDHLLTEWQEMFYPLKLREYLSRLPRFDDNGQPDLRQPLLINHHTVVDLPEPDGYAIDGYLMTWLVSGLPLIFIAGIMIVRSRQALVELPGWCFRIFGLLSLWWGATHGFFGLTHFAAWVFSSHTDLHRNINILLFWPLDMLVLTIGVQMGILGRAWKYEGYLTPRFWRNFAKWHVVLIPIYAGIVVLGITKQDASRVVLFMAPLSLLYYLVMLRLTYCSPIEREKD